MLQIPIIKQIPPEFIFGKTYYADTFGNIRNSKGKTLKARFSQAMRTHKGGSNYPIVEIAGKNFSIHKLVCAAFYGMPQPDQVCHHLDGNKFNNRPENLIWLYPKEHTKFDNVMRQGRIYIHVDGLLQMAKEMEERHEF